ncbi:hypothetical protein [Falsiroseomonas sp.]|uniref:hypothetical protein n=1 Tax=Falsiroseomonas sp. TaxID=2870721 RepID=UPI003F6EE61D
MSRAERDRLARDLLADPALATRLKPALEASPAQAAAALQAAGYAIEPGELALPQPAPLSLDQAALDRVAGGYMNVRNTLSPFEELP